VSAAGKKKKSSQRKGERKKTSQKEKENCKKGMCKKEKGKKVQFRKGIVGRKKGSGLWKMRPDRGKNRHSLMRGKKIRNLGGRATLKEEK